MSISTGNAFETSVQKVIFAKRFFVISIAGRYSLNFIETHFNISRFLILLKSTSFDRIFTVILIFLFNRYSFSVFKTRVKECIWVIAYIVSETTRMNSFEESHACNFVQIISFLVDDALQIFVFNIVRAKQLFEIFLTEGLERTSMIFLKAWTCLV